MSAELSLRWHVCGAPCCLLPGAANQGCAPAPRYAEPGPGRDTPGPERRWVRVGTARGGAMRPCTPLAGSGVLGSAGSHSGPGQRYPHLLMLLTSHRPWGLRRLSESLQLLLQSPPLPPGSSRWDLRRPPRAHAHARRGTGRPAGSPTHRADRQDQSLPARTRCLGPAAREGRGRATGAAWAPRFRRAACSWRLRAASASLSASAAAMAPVVSAAPRAAWAPGGGAGASGARRPRGRAGDAAPSEGRAGAASGPRTPWAEEAAA